MDRTKTAPAPQTVITRFVRVLQFFLKILTCNQEAAYEY
jgi:hypothetical protein